MRHLLRSALVMLSFADTGAADTAAFRSWQWQRAIVPASASPAAAQCVVLDAALYTNAVPGLRDVRLLQDGREIPYAVQESFDERTIGSGVDGRPHDDRSLYTTVLAIDLTQVLSKNVIGGNPQHIRGVAVSQQGGSVLPAHVPVERIVLVPALIEHGLPGPRPVPKTSVGFSLQAVPGLDDPLALLPADRDRVEAIEDELDPKLPVEMTTIGANLQQRAGVSIAVKSESLQFSSALLQMHQRSICFQPLSRMPLTLLLGNPAARPVHYDYAVHFQPVPTPLLATLGPLQRNPMYRPRAGERPDAARMNRIVLAAAVTLGGFLLAASALLGRSRHRSP